MLGRVLSLFLNFYHLKLSLLVIDSVWLKYSFGSLKTFRASLVYTKNLSLYFKALFIDRH